MQHLFFSYAIGSISITVFRPFPRHPHTDLGM
jgi:hypothetical protein